MSDFVTMVKNIETAANEIEAAQATINRLKESIGRGEPVFVEVVNLNGEVKLIEAETK